MQSPTSCGLITTRLTRGTGMRSFSFVSSSSQKKRNNVLAKKGDAVAEVVTLNTQITIQFSYKFRTYSYAAYVNNIQVYNHYVVKVANYKLQGNRTKSIFYVAAVTFVKCIPIHSV